MIFINKLNKFLISSWSFFYYSHWIILCGNYQMWWLWFWLWIYHNRECWESGLWLLGSYEQWTWNWIFTRNFSEICEKENPSQNSNKLEKRLRDYFYFLNSNTLYFKNKWSICHVLRLNWKYAQFIFLINQLKIKFTRKDYLKIHLLVG